MRLDSARLFGLQCPGDRPQLSSKSHGDSRYHAYTTSMGGTSIIADLEGKGRSCAHHSGYQQCGFNSSRVYRPRRDMYHSQVLSTGRYVREWVLYGAISEACCSFQRNTDKHAVHTAGEALRWHEPPLRKLQFTCYFKLSLATHLNQLL